MKIAIVGSREFEDYGKLEVEVLSHFTLEKIKMIVSGDAKGADTLASQFAKTHGIPLLIHRPEWKKYGLSAGTVRNTKIVNDADCVIAFPLGQSKGTWDTIRKAERLRKKVLIINN